MLPKFFDISEWRRLPCEESSITYMGCAIEQKKYICDDRGKLREIRTASVNRPINHVYVTSCFNDVIKGWHLHREQTDYFHCLKGVFKVNLVDEIKGVLCYTSVVLSEYDPRTLMIPKGVLHGFTSLDGEGLMLNANDRAYNHSDPDEYRVKPYSFDFEDGYFWGKGSG